MVKSKMVKSREIYDTNANTIKLRQSRWLTRGFVLLWFAITAFLLFGQSLGYDYTYLDDQSLVLNSMNRISHMSYIPETFKEDAFHSPPGNRFYYRPLLTTSFIFDSIAGQGKFSMFHFSNILYHLLATFLLFLFLTELGYDRLKSFLFALIFLVHPVITQTVAWVPGRNDTLLAVFVLTSFLSFLKYLRSNFTPVLILHFLFFTLALFTKETVIVLPLLLFVYGLLIYHKPFVKMVVMGVIWVLIASIWLIIRYHALGDSHGYTIRETLIPFIGNLPGIFPFLGKSLFPFRLSVSPVMSDMKVSFLLGLLATGILGFMLFLTKSRRWVYFIFAALWFILFLLPSLLTNNPKVITNYSEHRYYLPLMGIIIFIQECDPVRKVRVNKILSWSLIIVVLFFAVLTFSHMQYFKDKIVFWQNAVSTSPSNAFNYNNLGAMYFLNQDLGKAEIYFRKAVEINPFEPKANGNIGLICMRTGRAFEAEKYYLEEIRINPEYDDVYCNFGLLCYNTARADEAIKLWEKTLIINPCYADAYHDLMIAYYRLKRKDDYQRIALLAEKNGIHP